jgi:CheY-like chemotaxis protein
MTCLVVEHSQDIRERLCLLLLDLGVRGFPAATRAEAIAVLRSLPRIDLAIVDVDNREAEGLRLMQDLGKAQKTKKTRIIVHSAHTDTRFLDQMAGRGARGYLPKPFDDHRTGTNLRAIFQEPALGLGDKREHLRVPPDEAELMRVSFRITQDSRLYAGRVRNLSMGGMAIELFNPPARGLLQQGWRIPRLEFVIGSRPLAPSALIVLYTGRLLAVRFETMSNQERQHMARYILRRLNES